MKRTGFGRGVTRALGGLLILLALTIAGLWSLAATEAGRGLLVRWLTATMEEPGVLTVRVATLGPGLPGRLHIEGLSVADGDGAWLEIASITVDWSPWALVTSGRLHVREARIEAPVLHRLPASDDGSDDGSAFPPPLDLKVERLVVERARLGPEILGQPIAFRAEITADADPSEALEARLLLERTDGFPAAVHGTVRLEAGDETLAVDLTAREPADGILATLLDIPGRPPVSLTVAGTGPVVDWRGRVTAQADQVASLDLAARFRVAERVSLELDGPVDLAALVPEDARVLATGLVLDLGAEAALDGSAANATVLLANGAWEAAIEGRLDTPDGPLAATLRGSVVDGAILEGLLEGLRLDGATLDAQVTTRGAWFEGDLDGTTRLAVTGLRGAWVAGMEEALAPEPVVLQTRARVDLPRERIEIGQFDIASALLTASGDGEADLTRGQVHGVGALTIPSLSPLSGLAGLPLRGSGDGSFVLTLPGSGGGAVEAALHLEKAAIGQPEVDRLLAPGVDAAARLSWDDQGGLKLAPVSVDLEGLALEAVLDLPPGLERIEGTYTARAHRLSTLVEWPGHTIEGGATIHGTVTGALEDPSTALTLESAAVALDGLALSRLSARGEARHLRGDVEARLSMDAASASGPLKIETAASIQSGRTLAVKSLQARLGKARGSGKAIIDLDGGLARGTADLSIPDLGSLAPLVGVHIDGAAEAHARFSSRQGRQEIHATARASGIETAGVAIATLAASGELGLGGDEPRLTLSATATDIKTAAGTIATALARVEGPPGALAWRLSAQGAPPLPVDLSANGRISLTDEETVRVALAGFRGKVVDVPFSLTRATRITVAGPAITLDPTELTIGKGRLAVQGGLDRDTLSAEVGGHDLPLTLARAIAPDAALTGRLGVNGTLRLTPGQDRADLRFDIADATLAMAGAPAMPPLSITARAQLTGSDLALSAGMSGPTREPVTAQGSLRLTRPPGGGLPTPDPNGPVTGRLRWSGDLAEIEPLLPVAGHRMAGATRIDLGLGGRLSAPALTGGARVSSADYENVLLGTRLVGVDATLKADDAGRLVLSGTAGDDGQGRLTLSAHAFLTDGVANLTATMETQSFRVIRRDEADALASGRLALTTEHGQRRLAGDVTLSPVEIRLMDKLPASVTELEISEDGSGKAGAGAGDELKTVEGPIALDITAHLPNRVFVRGRGVDSEWQGKIRVTGTSAAPRITGSLTVVRGDVQALGKTFAITRGQVTLDGSTPPDPDLDIVASTPAEGMEVLVRVSGRASSPALTLSSTPPLPQDEILSRMLYGKGKGELGPAEALALLDALESLRDGGGGGIMDRIRKATGLDVLTASSGEEGDPGVSVGKYLGDKVFVGARQGLEPGSGSVTIEVDLTDTISIESELGSNAKGNLGINWKVDY